MGGPLGVANKRQTKEGKFSGLILDLTLYRAGARHAKKLLQFRQSHGQEASSMLDPVMDHCCEICNITFNRSQDYMTHM